jgi:formate hydrogenlyase subunit 6/NADH:ubiquinone oxidoreductase subunit I
MLCCVPYCDPAVLDPVIGKSTVKRGKAVIMKIGDAEVEVDPKFRLYLQVSTDPGCCQCRLCVLSSWEGAD